MVIRLVAALTLVVALGAAMAWSRSHSDAGPPLQVGAASPVAVAAEAPTLLWIFRGDDCLSCTAPTYRLRRLQRDSVHPVQLALIAVEGDEELVRSFARRERLGADITILTAEEYRSSFGTLDPPALLLIHKGRVVGIWADREQSPKLSPEEMIAGFG